MNREEGKGKELSQALELLGIPKEDCYLAQEYVYGQAKEEVLSRFGLQDLSELSEEAEEKFGEVFKAVRKLRKKEAEGRLFTLLFALGGESCYRLVPEEMVNGEKNLPGIAPEKKAAIYAARIGTELYSVGAYKLRSLIGIAGGKTEVLKKALCCGNGKTANGKVILLAVYFMVKYGNQVIAGEAGEETVEADDAALMRQYEEIVTGNYQKYLETVERKKRKMQAKSASGNHGAAKEAVSLPPELRLKTFDLEHLFCLTVGMAYLNFRLSARLKELVWAGLAAEPVRMLDLFLGISEKLVMDIRFRGGAFDQEFGLDKENYIYWAARKGLTEILEVQFQNNREEYLKVLERVESEYFKAQAENDHSNWRVVDNAMQAEEADECIFEVIEKRDPALHRELLAKRRQDGGKQEMDQLIAAVVPEFEDAGVIKAYLYGQGEASLLYPCLERLREQKDSSARWMETLLDSYLKKYQNEGFRRRCQVLMLLWHSSSSAFFLSGEISEQSGEDWEVQPRLVKELFRNFSLEGVGISYQLEGVVYLGDWYVGSYDRNRPNKFLEGAEECFFDYLKEHRQETLAAFAESEAFGRFFALRVMRRAAQENKEEILKYSQDTAKLVKQELFDILCERRDWEEDVKNLLSSKKAAERELGVRVLSVWQEAGADYRELFYTVSKKEKNSKIQELLGNMLAAAPEGKGGAREFSREELVEQLHKGNKKRSLAWAYETPFSEVHFAAGYAGNGEADRENTTAEAPAVQEKYLQAILLCYASSGEALNFAQRASDSSEKTFPSGEKPSAGGGISKNAMFLAEALNKAEFAVYVGELFDKWLAAGAESKKRWVLYAAAIHGGDAMIEKLKRQIKEWPQCARGAIACEAVRALVLNPLPQALLFADEIARNFRFKQVKAAADAALDFAAGQFGISREELADRIVPDFGFDENGERYFDYGGRAFLAVLTPELELVVYAAEADPQTLHEQEGETAPETLPGQAFEKGAAALNRRPARGKKLKNLPAPGKKDDAAKAAAAYEEWKQLKKQLKATINSQKQRMEQALWSAREWDVKSWKQHFVKNPIMRPFAGGLVWGIYQDGKLTQSFRYMEDGSFNTADEEEYVLPENGKISLVHPLDLTKERNMAWRRQLADYEIIPPVEQLVREVYRCTEAEAGQKELARFNDLVVDNISFCSSLAESGWFHGQAEDAGIFDTWYREDAGMGIGVELDFSGTYVGERLDEDVTVYCARFYKLEKGKTEREWYGSMEEEKIYRLDEVPERYFSEVVRQLVKAVGRNE